MENSILQKDIIKSGVIDYLNSVSEDVGRFDKLVKAVRNTPDLSKIKSAKLLKIAGKIRGIKESRVMNSSSIEKSGPTIDVKATEVKDKKKEDKKKNGAIVKSKGSSLANRGNKNTEVKDERKPKPYRDSNKKKDKGKPVNWKKAREKARDVAGAAVKATKAAAGGFAAGFDPSQNVKEEVSRRKKPSAIRKQKKLAKALSTLKYKKEKMVK
mgnify:CR=1 FL=1